MNVAVRAREANMLGALLLAGGDALRDAVEGETPSAASAPGALVALAELARDSSIGELGAVVGLGHSGTVRLVDRLESEGLVARSRFGRTVSVRLTRRGHATARRVARRRDEVLESLLSPLSASERDRLGGLLGALLRGLPGAGAEPSRVCRLCDPGACGRREGHCPVAALAEASESHEPGGAPR